MELKDGAFIDVGANIGAYTIRVANKYPQNQVVAIEVDSDNVKVLNQNVILNQRKNVTIVHKGCFSKKGTMEFYKDLVGSGGGSLVDPISNCKVKVEVDTLDNILRTLKVGKVDLIKTDAEGAEPLIFQGARKTIKKHKPVVIYEAHDSKIRKQCSDFFENIKYSVEKIDVNGFVARPR